MLADLKVMKLAFVLVVEWAEKMGTLKVVQTVDCWVHKKAALTVVLTVVELVELKDWWEVMLVDYLEELKCQSKYMLYIHCQ